MVFLIVGLMGLMMINKAIFLHSHVLDAKTTIIHAHPFGSSEDSQPNNKNHHTKTAFYFYENLDLLFLSVVLNHANCTGIKSVPVFFRPVSDYTSNYFSQLHGRSPPALQ